MAVTNYDEVDIVNNSLTRIGQSPITSFGDISAGATILRATYAQERDALLRRIPWSFARKWIALNRLQSAPIQLNIGSDADTVGGIGLFAAFGLPNDFLRMYRFSPYDVHWRIVGAAIFTDAVPAASAPIGLIGTQPPNGNGNNIPSSGTDGLGSTIGFEYIAQITDPNLWDSLFRDALIARMSWILSMGITAQAEVQQACGVEYKAAVADAAAVNGMENWTDTWNDTIVRDVRWGYANVGRDW